MTTRSVAWRRRLKAAERNVHGLWQILKAVVSTDHPLLAHLIPIRRCNLACTYCNEFDDFSKPVPTEQMLRRVGPLGEVRDFAGPDIGGRPATPPPLFDINSRLPGAQVPLGRVHPPSPVTRPPPPHLTPPRP